MAARKAPAAPPDEEEKADDATGKPAGEVGGDDAGGGGGSGGDQPEDARIREIVRDVVAEFLGGGGDGGGDDEVAPRGRLIDEERAVEQRVRRELERVAAQSKVEELDLKVRAIVEKPPVRWRRSTRFMGWVDEDDR